VPGFKDILNFNLKLIFNTTQIWSWGVAVDLGHGEIRATGMLISAMIGP
jgi:hypothetical protein